MNVTRFTIQQSTEFIWLLGTVPFILQSRHYSEPRYLSELIRTVNELLVQVRMLSEAGVKEVTLLGQNVNSYADWSQAEGGAAPSRTPGAAPTDAAAAVYAQVQTATSQRPLAMRPHNGWGWMSGNTLVAGRQTLSVCMSRIARGVVKHRHVCCISSLIGNSSRYWPSCRRFHYAAYYSPVRCVMSTLYWYQA